LDSKGQAVHDDMNKFVSCLIAVELTGGGSKLVNWVLYAVLYRLGVYYNYAHTLQQLHIDFNLRNWLLLEAKPVVVM